MEVRNCDWETGTERQLELKYCPSALAWQPGLLVVLNTYAFTGIGNDVVTPAPLRALERLW